MDPQIFIPPSSLHQIKGMEWRNEGERYDCTPVSLFTKTKESTVTTLIHHYEGGKELTEPQLDSTGGDSGQLPCLYPITPLNKSYQILFFSHGIKTQMTEALVSLHYKSIWQI